MTALMPRLFGDVAEWFETDLPHYPLLVRPGQLIRVEDERTDKEYTLRAELPGLTRTRTSRCRWTAAC